MLFVPDLLPLPGMYPVLLNLGYIFVFRIDSQPFPGVLVIFSRAGEGPGEKVFYTG